MLRNTNVSLHTFLVISLILISNNLYAQPTPEDSKEEVLQFVFRPGNDTLYLQGNEAEFQRLYTFVDQHLPDILSGKMPVQVDGYSTSAASPKANYRLAFIRSNRVKSELITHKKLQEKHFITQNHTSLYRDQKDVVIVTLRLPGEAPEPVVEEQPEKEVAVTQPAGEAPEPDFHAETQPVVEPEPETPRAKGGTISIRTNLLYDAFLLPTLGIEWRPTDRLGIKVDGSYSFWGNEHGRVQKIWLVSPEVRWYLGDARRLYAGVSANVGEFNIYKGMIGNMVSSDTGYQGTIRGGGLTVGYQLPLGRSFAIDFNLGLGYTRMEYNSFTMSNEIRVYKDRNRSKDIWGPTQAGITLVWTPL